MPENSSELERLLGGTAEQQPTAGMPLAYLFTRKGQPVAAAAKAWRAWFPKYASAAEAIQAAVQVAAAAPEAAAELGRLRKQLAELTAKRGGAAQR